MNYMFTESFDADKERSEALAVERVYDQLVLSLRLYESFFLEKIHKSISTGVTIQKSIENIIYPYIQKTEIYQKTVIAPATLDEAIAKYEDMIAEKMKNYDNSDKEANKTIDIGLKDVFTAEGREVTPEESEKFDIYTKIHLLKNLEDHPIQLPKKGNVSPQQREDFQTIRTDLKTMISNESVDYRDLILDFFEESETNEELSSEDIIQKIMKKYHIHGEDNAMHLKDCLIRATKIYSKK